MKAKHIYLLICSAFFVTGLLAGNVLTESKKEIVTVTEVSTNTVIEKVEVPKIVKLEVIKELERVPEMELSEADKALIAGVVWAEAGNQDYIGKRLVVDVVLNRLNSEHFPNTVHGVIYATGQFAKPSAYYDDECIAAVEAECMERLDYEIMFFKKYDYFKDLGEPAFQHGAHYFSWGEL